MNRVARYWPIAVNEYWPVGNVILYVPAGATEVVYENLLSSTPAGPNPGPTVGVVFQIAPVIVASSHALAPAGTLIGVESCTENLLPSLLTPRAPLAGSDEKKYVILVA